LLGQHLNRNILIVPFSSARMKKGNYLKDQHLLDITTKKEIDRIETELLFETTDRLLDEFDNIRQFTTDDILEMHRRWLGSVYEWAGKYRQVKMSKGNFIFAVPAYIPQLMENFKKELLAQYTPCLFNSRQDVVYALAIVHTELILIHPSREGNGRIA
jgi:cell filamentation protein